MSILAGKSSGPNRAAVSESRAAKETSEDVRTAKKPQLGNVSQDRGRNSQAAAVSSTKENNSSSPQNHLYLRGSNGGAKDKRHFAGADGSNENSSNQIKHDQSVNHSQRSRHGQGGGLSRRHMRNKLPTSPAISLLRHTPSEHHIKLSKLM